MKVLIACEFSGVVRDAFAREGHDAMSCDLLPTEAPGKHYTGNVFDLNLTEFDLIIAHPPCTYLTCSAEWAYVAKPMINGMPRNMKKGTLVGEKRLNAREDALNFVKGLWDIPVNYMCIENPVGVIAKRLPQMGTPQYVQPYWFGEDASKKTGLWLRGLPPLTPTNMIKPRVVNGLSRWGNQTDAGQNKLPPSSDRWKLRSITPTGIADAMAVQWGCLEGHDDR